MPRIDIKLTPNDFFTTKTESVLLTILDRYETLDISFGYIFLGYPNWNQPDINLFQYLDQNFINQLRDKKTVLIVDYTYEGFSYLECPVIKILEKNCELYQIDPKKIFYFSGNLKDSSNLINTVPIFLLDYPNNFNSYDNNIDKIRYEFHLKDQKDILLSLSRRNRQHRVFAHSMLFNSSLKEWAVISQDKLENSRIDKNTLDRLELSEKQWKKYYKSLPLIADDNVFHINDPFNLLPSLHNKTCFSIVNETSINDYNNSSLFFSEKILKPIINFQPMVIYGQVGINHALTDLGFKCYDDYFDLSFDYEQDNFMRYRKLLQNIDKTVKKLSKMSILEQFNWRLRYIDILKHNYDNFIKQTHSKTAASKFYKKISEL